MRGKAQPDGRPAVELIETLVLLFVSLWETNKKCSVGLALASLREEWKCCSVLLTPQLSF